MWPLFSGRWFYHALQIAASAMCLQLCPVGPAQPAALLVRRKQPWSPLASMVLTSSAPWPGGARHWLVTADGFGLFLPLRCSHGYKSALPWTWQP